MTWTEVPDIVKVIGFGLETYSLGKVYDSFRDAGGCSVNEGVSPSNVAFAIVALASIFPPRNTMPCFELERMNPTET